MGLSTEAADATDILLIDFRASCRMYRAQPIEVALGWQDDPGHWQFASRVIRPGADWRDADWSQDHAEDDHALSLVDLQHGFSARRVLIWMEAMAQRKRALSTEPADTFSRIHALSREAGLAYLLYPGNLREAIEERSDEDTAAEAITAFFDAEYEGKPCSARISVELMARHWDLALGDLRQEAA